jgi:hypothetical protein
MLVKRESKCIKVDDTLMSLDLRLVQSIEKWERVHKAHFTKIANNVYCKTFGEMPEFKWMNDDILLKQFNTVFNKYFPHNSIDEILNGSSIDDITKNNPIEIVFLLSKIFLKVLYNGTYGKY